MILIHYRCNFSFKIKANQRMHTFQIETDKKESKLSTLSKCTSVILQHLPWVTCYKCVLSLSLFCSQMFVVKDFCFGCIISVWISTHVWNSLWAVVYLLDSITRISETKHVHFVNPRRCISFCSTVTRSRSLTLCKYTFIRLTCFIFGNYIQSHDLYTIITIIIVHHSSIHSTSSSSTTSTDQNKQKPLTINVIV